MKANKTAEPIEEPVSARAPDDSESMILLVESEETPFAPIAEDDGLDLTLAAAGRGWRCDWLEVVSGDA